MRAFIVALLFLAAWPAFAQNYSSYPSSGLTSAANIGTGNALITLGGGMKSIAAGAGISLADDGSTITITNTGGGGVSPLTTKGDLYTFAAADARLAVGADGQILSADSTQATGLRWINNTVGTVTSVDMTVPAEFIIAGNPITTSGTLALTKATQLANLVYAGPAAGGAVVPTFRSLVVADIPVLPYASSALTTDHIYVGAAGVATDVAMSGDASIVATGALTVNTVGGSTAALINSAELLANAATDLNTTTAIVRRDAQGGFSAGDISVGTILSSTTLPVAVVASHTQVRANLSNTGTITGDAQMSLMDAQGSVDTDLYMYNASSNMTVGRDYYGFHDNMTGAITRDRYGASTNNSNTVGRDYYGFIDNNSGDVTQNYRGLEVDNSGHILGDALFEQINSNGIVDGNLTLRNAGNFQQVGLNFTGETTQNSGHILGDANFSFINSNGIVDGNLTLANWGSSQTVGGNFLAMNVGVNGNVAGNNGGIAYSVGADTGGDATLMGLIYNGGHTIGGNFTGLNVSNASAVALNEQMGSFSSSANVVGNKQGVQINVGGDAANSTSLTIAPGAGTIAGTVTGVNINVSSPTNTSPRVALQSNGGALQADYTWDSSTTLPNAIINTHSLQSNFSVAAGFPITAIAAQTPQFGFGVSIGGSFSFADDWGPDFTGARIGYSQAGVFMGLAGTAGKTIDMFSMFTVAGSVNAGTGGTITDGNGIRVFGILPSAGVVPTIPNFSAVHIDAAYDAAIGTNKWGFDNSSNTDNYFAKNLIIGGVSKQPDNANVGLELTFGDKALLLSRMTTVQKLAMTPLEGMIVADTDLHTLQFYDGTTWADATAPIVWFQETPAGLPDDVLVTFTLANIPVDTASLELSLDGLVLRVGIDYTIVADTITMTTAPATSQELWAKYY